MAGWVIDTVQVGHLRGVHQVKQTTGLGRAGSSRPVGRLVHRHQVAR